MTRWVVFLGILLLIELYAFQAVRTVFRNRWVAIAFEAVSLAMIAYIIYALLQFDRSVGQNKYSLAAAGLMLLLLVPKLVMTVILMAEDVVRITSAAFRSVTRQGITPAPLPDRRRFLSMVALGLASVPFLGLLHGIFIGKYNFRIIRKQIFFDDLPDSFDGFTITHISDLHSGSFDNPDKIRYAVDLINSTEPDLLLFTGDIVNSKAEEMDPWIDTFRTLSTPEFGKFSVLGNHDYGEYLRWDSEAAKIANFEAIKGLHDKIGFRLMLNEHHFIAKGSDRLALIGVENWGHNFKKAGDFGKASAGVASTDFKILMTHDPSHWDLEIREHQMNVHLTLAGHTHGMQFGIEVPGWIKWSPVQYVYRQWAGLYNFAGRYLYVNRGFGFHAYPGRVGIWPEITVLELKKRAPIA